MKVLVINTGSSSLKYQILNMKDETLLCKGLVERIGGKDAKIIHKVEGKKHEEVLEIKDHEKALNEVLKLIVNKEFGCLKDIKEIVAVGHRVVHGGEKFASSVLITDEVKKALEENIELAPLHNPPNLLGIEAAEKLLPGVPMVGVFDTAFHQTMSPEAYLYPIPYEIYHKYKIRRYGFHGTSHRFVSQRASELLNKNIEDLKMITVHLGNGASIAAINGGKVIDTSMGFTPLEGVVMGTRSGDIDPSIPIYLIRKGYTPDEVDNILNKKSGMYGLSNYLSNDMRDIREAKSKGDEHCKFAIDVYVYRIAKYIGAYATALGGIDAVIFTAGVGENSTSIRRHVCNRLKIFGVELDQDKNVELNSSEAIISSENSKVDVLIVPTNEELMIARDTRDIIVKKVEA